MRIAIVSDIHGNRAAFEAVLADLRHTSPDLILHGGDLADAGSSPAEIVDRIRDLGWPGVLGNTDEMHARPESLDEFASQSSAPPSLWQAIREMAAATRDVLGEERISWMRGLPRVQIHDRFALVHASAESAWRSPGAEASDAELEAAYAPLGRPVVIYGHIHRPFIRKIAAGLVVINTGSVSLSYDGDSRPAYLLLDDSGPTIRRVAYDVEKEIQALFACRLPHSNWVAKTLRSAFPQMP
jgi:putative phosphoesterase